MTAMRERDAYYWQDYVQALETWTDIPSLPGWAERDRDDEDGGYVDEHGRPLTYAQRRAEAEQRQQALDAKRHYLTQEAIATYLDYHNDPLAREELRAKARLLRETDPSLTAPASASASAPTPTLPTFGRVARGQRADRRRTD